MKTDLIQGEFYVQNASVFSTKSINYKLETSAYRLYEVLRTNNCRLIFLNDHVERMQIGFAKLNQSYNFDSAIAKKHLQKVVEVNQCRTGNVKLYAGLHQNQMELAAAYIPHKYPPDSFYSEGVKLALLHAERSSPGIKQLDVSEYVRSRLQKQDKTHYFESLLINHSGYITEGTRSNFFLVKDYALYSAPDELLLPGITRKYVLKLAANLNIPVMKENIHVNALPEFDAAFICGTSPKILPVAAIENTSYSPNNALVKTLMHEYNKLID